MHPEIFMFQHYPNRSARDAVTLVAKLHAAVGPFRIFGCHLYRNIDGEFSLQAPPCDGADRGIGLRSGPLRDELLTMAVKHYEAVSTI